MGQCDDPNCNGLTEFDETAQAIVCTNCGKVVNHATFRDDWDGETAGSSFYFGPTALKSLRRVGANLSGMYDKEERDRKNSYAMHQYIAAILTRLTCSGLTERACRLFDQVRTLKPFKWGKKAVLVAGVCIAIALRENKKGVLLQDLSVMLNFPSGLLFRNINQVTDILGIQLPSLDPIALLSRIQTYTMELINMPDTPLPKNLCTFIGKISATQVIRLASALVALITQIEELPLGSSPLSMTCAIFLVALEGQSAESLPSHRLLAKELASRVNVRKDLVLQHYNAILDVMASWMVDVPWLSSSRDPDNLRSKRRKTSHRHVVAMGIKEVIRFRAESLKAGGPKSFGETPVPSPEATRHDDSSDEDSPVEIGQKRKRVEVSSERPISLRFLRPPSRRMPLSQLDIASLSLLSLHHPLSAQTTFKPQNQSTGNQDGLVKTIMTSSVFPEDRQYSRLQLLLNERGGEAFIQDDELFDEAEFDDVFRSEEELIKLRTIYGWDDNSTSGPPPLEPGSTHDWNSVDMDFWAELGEHDGKLDGANETEIDSRISDEQIIGEWREASPIGGLQLDEDDDLNFQSD